MPAVRLLPLMIDIALATKGALTDPAKSPVLAANAGFAFGTESLVSFTKAQ